MKSPDTRYARTPDGLHIAYQVFGDGPIDVVFDPEWFNHVEVQWEQPFVHRFYEKLSSFSRVIVFDKRGTGASDAVVPGDAATLETWMDDVRAVMDSAGCERAALFGHGGGGAVQILCAATYPERASALVLFNAYARLTQAPDYPMGYPATMIEAASEVTEPSGPMSEFMLSLLAPTAPQDDRFREWFGRFNRLAASPGARRALTELMTTVDVRDILPAIRVPTLVIHHASNAFIRVENGRYLAEHIPDAKYAELPGADHVFCFGDVDAALGEVEEFLTGIRTVPESERTLATVLMTDVVDSTKRAADLGDHAWSELLRRHDEICLEELDRYRGRPVKHTGDGLVATFDGPARAIRCASAIRDAVRSVGLEIRAGLHTGELELIDSDVRGIAVHLAARVTNSAGPGEVLVSRTVTDLVAGSGIEFVDRGEHELKGVPGVWQLYAVKL